MKNVLENIMIIAVGAVVISLIVASAAFGIIKEIGLLKMGWSAVFGG